MSDLHVNGVSVSLPTSSRSEQRLQQVDQMPLEPQRQSQQTSESSVFSKLETSQQLQSAAAIHSRAILQQAPSDHLRSLLDVIYLEALHMLSAAGETAEQRSMQEWAAAVLLGPKWKRFSAQAAEEDDAPDAIQNSSSTTSVDFYGFACPANRSSRNFDQVKQLQAHRFSRWQHWLSGHNIRQVPCSYLSPTCQVELQPAPVMSSEMRDLVRKGVPVDLRGCIWYQVSGALFLASKTQAQRKEGELSYYQQKLQDLEAVTEYTQSQRDILKDVGRTWTSNIVHMDAAFRFHLQNVLMCYSIRNPQIGYCQSMNFVTGLFLLFLDEESAFWLLATLVEELMPQFFGRSLFALVRDQEILSQYVKEKLPRLFAHFKSLECDASAVQLMTTEWFLCIFCKSLPIETAFRIWDLFFYDGPKVIFRCALSILKIFEEDLIKEQSELEMVSKLAELTNELFDADKIIETCFAEFRSITRADLSHRRKVVHMKMAKTVTSEASQSAYARIHDYTHIGEKAAKSLLADFEGNHQSAPCLHDNEGQMFSTVVDYISFSSVCRFLFKWAANCTLQNNTGASARTAMLLLFQALGGDSLRMTISFADMVIGIWKLLFGTPEERLKIAFQFLDTDRNGRLKRANVLSVLSVIQILFQHTRATDNFRLIDEDQSTKCQLEQQTTAEAPLPQVVDVDIQLQLGNIEFCQRCLGMLFGDAMVSPKKMQSEEGASGSSDPDQCKEINEATFCRNAKSVAMIVEFFYLNRTASRTTRSLLWVIGFDDDLSFAHVQKFAANFDRDCNTLINMIRAEQWPNEDEKKSGFSFFSPKKSETNRAGHGEVSGAEEGQFSGKSLVDFLLKIRWQNCRSRRSAVEWCQNLVDFYFIFSLHDQGALRFDEKATYGIYSPDIAASLMEKSIRRCSR